MTPTTATAARRLFFHLARPLAHSVQGSNIPFGNPSLRRGALCPSLPIRTLFTLSHLWASFRALPWHEYRHWGPLIRIRITDYRHWGPYLWNCIRNKMSVVHFLNMLVDKNMKIWKFRFLTKNPKFYNGHIYISQSSKNPNIGKK